MNHVTLLTLVHSLDVCLTVLWSKCPSPSKKWKEKKFDKATLQSSLFHSRAVDIVCSSHPVLFSGCLRQLPALEMKDACLATFKDSHNSECHLYCNTVFTPFYAQYGGDDQKDLKDLQYVCFTEDNNASAQTQARFFENCPLVYSTGETYLYWSIWKYLSSWKTQVFKLYIFKSPLNFRQERIFFLLNKIN